MSHSRKRFADLSIKYKYVIMLIFFAYLPFCALGISLVFLWNQQQVESSRQEDLEELKQTAREVSEFLQGVEDAVEQLRYDENINGVAQGYGNKLRYVEVMRRVKEISEDTESIAAVQILVGGIAEYTTGNVSFSPYGNETYTEYMRECDLQELWAPAHILHAYGKGDYNEESWVCSLYKKIYDVNNYRENGILAVHFLEKSLYEVYQSCEDESTLGIWIVNEGGELISSSEKAYFEKELPEELKKISLQNKSGYIRMQFDGKTSVLLYQRCEEINGYLYHFKLEDSASFYEILFLLLLTVLGMGVVLCLGFFYIQEKYVNRPIKRLLSRMELVKQGQLELERLPANQDEIGQLTISFDRMLERINGLIREVYVEQVNRKNAEIDMLLAQINPHFMYNTLDSIHWKALANNDLEVGEQLEALSGFLQGTLNFGQRKVTIRHELSLIEDYCYLLQKRFNGKIQLVKQVEEHVLEYEISKLLIQPLVENAFVHGLERKCENGKIWILVRVRRGYIQITVMDNGLGCDGKKIRQEMQKAEGKECFALRNVYRRILFEYNQQGKMHFWGIPGKGTFVQIELPLDE